MDGTADNVDFGDLKVYGKTGTAEYSTNKNVTHSWFENKPAGLSDYNMFVKVNMQRTPIYLTKQAVAGGACIATAYQISQGSLPAIVLTGTGQNVKTDIRLGGESITSSTTVAQFSAAVVNNNADYRYGDQISFFLVKQMVNAETGIPYCQFSAAKVILDAANEEKLADVTGSSPAKVRLKVSLQTFTMSGRERYDVSSGLAISQPF